MAMVFAPGTGVARELVAMSAETNKTRFWLYILGESSTREILMCMIKDNDQPMEGWMRFR
jgi:hypothetical protein